MKKILFVDDEPNILAAFQRQLHKHFQVDTAAGPAAGLAALQNWREYAVVVADMQMPEMNGVDFLVKVKSAAPDLVLMMLTGNADQATAVKAINRGNIFRFLNKPCPPEELVSALEAAVRQHELITAERELLEKTLNGSIKVLTEILALFDPIRFGHAEKLRYQVRQMATALKLGQTWELEAAALLANIGHVTLPPELVLKARLGQALSPRELQIFERVPEVGSNLLAQIPRLDEVARIILYQSQRFDGSAFPQDKVAGENLPVGSRILKVLADLSQLENKGVQRPAAIDEMRKRKDWYDPQMLNIVAGALCTEADERGPMEGTTRLVTFLNLRIGDVLAADLVTKDGVLIISAGNRVTLPMMQRLRNFAALSGVKEPIHVEA
jgi:response regulator RpfG family c-di-GMP phosphodiesterase